MASMVQFLPAAYDQAALTITGWGLKESKGAIEAAMQRHKSVAAE